MRRFPRRIFGVLGFAAAVFVLLTSGIRMRVSKAIPRDTREDAYHMPVLGADGPEDSAPLTVALAFSVTRDPMKQPELLDAVAVLVTGATRVSRRHTVQIVCLVPSAGIGKEANELLERLGVARIVQASFDVDVSGFSAVKREYVQGHGCCGIAEMQKMFAFTMEEYDWVVLVDLDVLIMRDLDVLFARPESLMYTLDMHLFDAQADYCAINGGFILLQPDRALFKRLVQVYQDTPFHEGTGWAGKRVGFTWGGGTIQGFLRYFAVFHMAPERVALLDSCIWNRRMDHLPKCSSNVDHSVRVSHFPGTKQKPWRCRGARPCHDHDCRVMQQAYRDRLAITAERIGMDDPETGMGCVGDKYKAITNDLH